MEGYHESVLLREVLNSLEVGDGKWYIDATLGDGGHSLGILRKGGKIVGIDVDPQAIERTNNRFTQEGIERNKWKLVRGNFREVKDLAGDHKFTGILFDLGVSSLQFDKSERGFSFSKEGSLDMRMDPSLSITALDLINGLNKGELYELFYKLGEEKFARAISSALVSSREVKWKIENGQWKITTKELRGLVENVYRKHGIRKWKIPAYAKASAGKHPATKVFQALRIAVNDELNALRESLPQALEILDTGGKVVVISFHSLEDRIVKNTFKDWEKQGSGMVVTKKPIPPADNEVLRNPRSRSAKMRVFEKI